MEKVFDSKQMNTPVTKKEDLVENLHGHLIRDPYRWLEDGDSEEVKQWIEDQDKYLSQSLRDNVFDEFSNELIKNFKVTNFSTPAMRNGLYFYSERQPDEDQHVIYWKKGINGEPTKLVDPNGINENNTVSVEFWSPSKSGKYIAYSLDEGGNEMSSLYVKDVATGVSLPDKIDRCRFPEVRWLSDDSGFYYVRNPQPGTVPKNEEHLHSKIYFHKLGNDPIDDELIFGKDRPKDDMLNSALSLDGRYLGIQSTNTWTKNDIYIYDRETKTITPLVTGIDARFNLMFLEGKAIIRTNYKANNERVLSMSLDRLLTPIDQWTEIIPESEYLLEGITATKSKLIGFYSVNAYSKTVVFDYDGKKTGEIPMPEYSNIAGFSARPDEEEFFYGIDSFTFPKIEYWYDPKKNGYELYRETENPINPENYVVKQEWYESKDKTKVPIFIFHKKNVSGKAPTVMYGYGGFKKTMNPGFMRTWVPWIERGGVFAIPCIRGGGEFGKKWHEDGIKEKKQNSFDDFIAAAEYLIASGYTDLNHLGILGGSNGGLLVSVVEIQRPDLFKAVVSRVPLTDMVRFPQFGIASRWTNEYGNPTEKEDLDNILKWSPYHNVKEGVKYPPTLFTTAENDSRVNPLHARKMVAMLQSVNKTNNVFLFTETEAGHGSGKPIKKIVEGQALVITFFAKKLEL